MMLIDRKPLATEALNAKDHPQHDFAKEYNNTLVFLKERYKNGYIRFKRTDVPKYTKGFDSRGGEIPKMMEPVPAITIPLKAYASVGNLGKHLWACCLDEPTILPNQLWDLGRKRTIILNKADILVDINKEPDLAFFLYKVSPIVRRGHMKIVDPKKDDEEIGILEQELTERKYAVWNMLQDEEKLKVMARAYGVLNVDNKQPNAIRKELEATLEKNDKLKRQNTAVKGTKDFLEEMKVTDGVLLRNFVQKAIDDKKITCKFNGNWVIGDKIIIQVPANALNDRTGYLCNYLSAGNNFDKLQSFMKDLLNRDYLDKITDTKEWIWLAKIAKVPHDFKKVEAIKTGVTEFFCPV